MKKTLLLAGLCSAVDQIIKYVLLVAFQVDVVNPVIKNFFNITLVLNDGAAFSTFKSKTLFLIVTSLLVIIWLVLYVRKNTLKNFEYIIYGVLLGGIVGNLIDRIIYSSVIDYLDFRLFGYSFPIFNFADICIVVSIIFIILFSFKGGVDGNSSN